MIPKAVAYYRATGAKEGRPGLGLVAQARAVRALCAAQGLELLNGFTEAERGARAQRPELSKALDCAKANSAALVIPEFRPLSRNAAFLMAICESGVPIQAIDMPDADASTLRILAAVAERERSATVERTRAALATAKSRGVRLGNPNGAAALRRAGKGNTAAIAANQARAASWADEHAALVAEARASGATSLRGLAEWLNVKGVRAPRGGLWKPTTVKRLLERLRDS